MNQEVAATDISEPLFDADFLRKIERLELIARKIFRGLLRGEHTTSRRGRGLEFSDFRRYRPGDDLRHIDWNIYSRLDRLFLKLYASEEDVTLYLLLDSSASMGFGDPAKFDYARRLAAALAYIGLNNMDRVGLSAFSVRLGKSLAPLNKQRMATLIEFLRELECRDETRFESPLGEFAACYPNPGLVVLISDLLGGDDIRRGLDTLQQAGHDIVLLQLLAEEEIEPPLEGALNLVDAEDGRELRVTVDAELRALYQRRLTRLLDDFENHCRRRGIDYLRTSTAIPFEDVVLKYLRQGRYLR